MSQRNAALKNMASLYSKPTPASEKKPRPMIQAVQVPEPAKVVNAVADVPIFDLAQITNMEDTLATKYPTFQFPPLETVVINTTKIRGSKNDTLVRKTGYYITFSGDKFHYFKTGGIEKFNEDIWKIKIPLPPVLREGFVVIDKEVYLVTLEDLKRRLIRKSRKLKLKKGTIRYGDIITGSAFLKPEVRNPTGPDSTGNLAKEPKFNTKSGASTKNSGIETGEAGRGGPAQAETRLSDIPLADILKSASPTKISGISGGVEMDESKVIDMAIQHQVGSLLSYAFEKEGDSGEEWEIQNDL